MGVTPHLRDRIKAFMATHKVSQNELARRLDVDKTYVSKWLNGRADPSTETLESIVEAIGGALALGDGDGAVLASLLAVPQDDREMVAATVGALGALRRDDPGAYDSFRAMCRFVQDRAAMLSARGPALYVVENGRK